MSKLRVALLASFVLGCFGCQQGFQTHRDMVQIRVLGLADAVRWEKTANWKSRAKWNLGSSDSSSKAIDRMAV